MPSGYSKASTKDASCHLFLCFHLFWNVLTCVWNSFVICLQFKWLSLHIIVFSYFRESQLFAILHHLKKKSFSFAVMLGARYIWLDECISFSARSNNNLRQQLHSKGPKIPPPQSKYTSSPWSHPSLLSPLHLSGNPVWVKVKESEVMIGDWDVSQCGLLSEVKQALGPVCLFQTLFVCVGLYVM